MTNQSLQRTEELSLLGWTQDGASNYGGLFESVNSESQSSLLSISIVTLIIISLFVMFALLRKSLFKPIGISSYNKDFINIEIKEVCEILPQELEANKLKSNNEKIIISDYIQSISNEFIDYTDIFISHLALSFYLLYQLFSLILPVVSTQKEDSFTPSFLNNDLKRKFAEMKDKDLKSIIGDENVINHFDRDNLIQMILSNPIAMNKFSFEERKNTLMRKTNQELKSILKGVNKISKLKKSELVEKILFIEYGK